MRITTRLQCVGLLVSLLAVSASADEGLSGSVGKSQPTWSGTLTAVDLRNHALQAQTWWMPQTFVTGKNCTISVMGEDNRKLSDLYPGDILKVTYRDMDGVLVANRISDQSLRYQGTVQDVDQNSNSVTIEQGHLARTFKLADDCKVVTVGEMDGSLYDLGPGDKVTVVYNLSGHAQVASRINKMSLSYQGKLEAIDLPERIVKTTDELAEKQFSVADHCRIVIGCNKNAQLKDLRLEHNYTFNYEQVNGVNVADQITGVTGAGMPDITSTD